jgi:DNA (cytosine-5)-methyltransferase 1
VRELHLFAGAGGGILGGLLLGHTPVAAVEIDKHCQKVLRQRQLDGMLPEFPIFDDVRTFDGTRFKGAVDVLAGGFPCQDISTAGKGAGIKGERSSMWFEMLRVVRECEPAYVFIENSPMLRARGLGTVLEGLADLGFDAAWDVVSAADCGAPHIRKRMWILASHPDRAVCEEQRECIAAVKEHAAAQRGGADAADTFGSVRKFAQQQPESARWAGPSNNSWWQAEPRVGRVVDGMANRVGQLRALGNGQVPVVAATAFRMLKARLEA